MKKTAKFNNTFCLKIEKIWVVRMLLVRKKTIVLFKKFIFLFLLFCYLLILNLFLKNFFNLFFI